MKKSLIALGGIALAAALPAPRASARPASKSGPVIVLGFDGADFHVTDRLMRAGRLPNLSKLAARGTFRPLTVTNPPQTPVSWSTFATGMNPGRTEIFDFLKREAGTYHPTFALNEEIRKPFSEVAPVNVKLWAVAGALLLGAIAGHLLKKKLGISRALGAGGLLALALAGGGLWAAARWLPREVPWPRNNRKGEPFWVTAAKHGARVEVLRVPATFPADESGGLRMISGLGVPDMRGGIGTPVLYTADPALTATTQEFSVDIVPLQPAGGQWLHPKADGTTGPVEMIGPKNKIFLDYVAEAAAGEERDPEARRKIAGEVRAKLRARGVPETIRVPIRLTRAGDGACYAYQSVRRCLKSGEWSPFEPVAFTFSPLVTLRGFVRFRAFSIEPHLTLYQSPINFHPDTHPLPLSWPAQFAGKLARRFGLYKTMGWVEDTWTSGAGLMDEGIFLEDVAFTRAQYRKMMEGLLKDDDYDLYVQVFEFTDRVGHILWRYTDPGHPGYKGHEQQAAKYGPEIDKTYEAMDEIVGAAMAAAPPGATILVVSDHGFTSFRRAVNYNTWLAQHGFITFKGQNRLTSVSELFDNNAVLFSNVDWTRTRAYALGLGNIYINLAGREPQGIVLPGKEYDETIAQIRAGLESLVDSETGEKPVFKVYTRDEMYKGFDPSLIPDLRVANNLHYRVSWQTSLGGAPDKLIEENLQPWSGDHCSMDPSLVPGIFFSSKKINTGTPAMSDIAPTLLQTLGAKPAQEMDGKPLY